MVAVTRLLPIVRVRLTEVPEADLVDREYHAYLMATWEGGNPLMLNLETWRRFNR